ncbi:DUF1501 domain-containing protein [Rivibacter subsaxonicus]|nr:DUF1501 domain-containing protein [Rivibacter subsaxonicus]
MQRRDLLGAAAATALGGLWLPGMAAAQAPRASGAADRVLVLVELRGGNDSLNTVVPYADPLYAQLRPGIGLRPDELLKLDRGPQPLGLHPALAALMPLWQKREMALLAGLGYPQPNLSHFRSIEIWDTASRADEVLDEGWIARAMEAGLRDAGRFTTEGVAVGSAGLGALAGAKAVSLTRPEVFVNQARSLKPVAPRGNNAALEHILRVEGDVSQAAEGLRGAPVPLATEFPPTAFGQACKAVCQIVAGQRGKGGVPVFHLTHGSFDTHQNQPSLHANLLRQLAEGLAALQGGLVEAGAWERTLVLSYAEFGRRARQNQSNGTDHGTAATHFALGGAVKGGVHGRQPALDQFDASGNLHHGADFRSVCATVAQRWWGVDPEPVVRGRFDAIDFLRT